MAKISVAVVEDDAGVRARVERAVHGQQALALACSAATAAELLRWMDGNLADVVLVDLGLPDLPGLEVIARCRRMQPACAVMVLTMFGDESHMLQAFEAGAQGYLLKDGTEDDLARHILALHGGGSPMSPIIARQLLARWKRETPTAVPATAHAAGLEALSTRESQVLDQIARGFTYAEIAAQLGLSVTTVQTHVRNIYGKLGVHNKTEAVFEARQAGLLR